jgi:hypothetical protein
LKVRHYLKKSTACRGILKILAALEAAGGLIWFPALDFALRFFSFRGFFVKNRLPFNGAMG